MRSPCARRLITRPLQQATTTTSITPNTLTYRARGDLAEADLADVERVVVPTHPDVLRHVRRVLFYVSRGGLSVFSEKQAHSD